MTLGLDQVVNFSDSPIFIHSLFRAGSTYLFNVFRRSEAGYWCYQEPLHELLRDSSDHAVWKDQAQQQQIAKHLRHPPIERPYYYEFFVVADSLKQYFRTEFCYETYFADEKSNLESLVEYLNHLASKARGRPVFQCCRSSGRIKWASDQCAGSHIYLWRHPWDQWWSFKVDDYFDVTNQMIVNARHHPKVIDGLRVILRFSEYHDADISKELAHFASRPLSPQESYVAFYTLWCLGLLEGRRQASLLINIDRLSDSAVYRGSTLREMQRLGITGLDFSDCHVPQGCYGDEDRKFFAAQEAQAHELLLAGGWSQAELDEVLTLRRDYEPYGWRDSADSRLTSDLIEQATRSRAIARRFESRVADTAHALVAKEAEVQRLNAHISWQQGEWEASKAELSRAQTDFSQAKTEATAQLQQALAVARQAQALAEQAETRARQAKGREGEAKVQLEQARSETETVRQELTHVRQANHHHWLLAEERGRQVQALLSSTSWRVTAPLRGVTTNLRSLGRLPGKVVLQLKIWLKPHAVRAVTHPASKRLIERTGRWVIDHPNLSDPIRALLRRHERLRNRLRWLVLGQAPAAVPGNAQAWRGGGDWVGAGDSAGLLVGPAEWHSRSSPMASLRGVNATQRGPLEATFFAYLRE